MIPVEEYLNFLDDQYLSTFIKGGGTAVKFCVADEMNHSLFKRQLLKRARDKNYFVVQLDSGQTRIQMIDQIFFEAARVVDWASLAEGMSDTACEAAGFASRALDGVRSIEELSKYYDMDQRELQRDVVKQLQTTIYRDYKMVHEFRIAMLRLCQFSLSTGQVSDAEYESINAWLKGEIRYITLLKSARIFRKISRANARQMLFSLTHWLVKNGSAGVILVLDLTQLFHKHLETDIGPPQTSYSRGAILDAYESIRQLIDNSNEFANIATFVCVPPEFITDRNRGLDLYQALKLRIYDEVRDENRDNPFGTLVRLGGADLVREEDPTNYFMTGNSLGY